MQTTSRISLARSLAALLCLAYTAAKAADEPNEKMLEEITVTGEAMVQSNESFTVNVIDRELLEERNLGDVLRAIEETAGVTMSTGAFAQGGVASAFQIRGFAEGGHGSDAAIYIDGISLNEGGSHGDGYADTNVIMPIELETIRIYKGPISPLYGNFARAGTLAFETRKGGQYQEADFFIGAFDTVNGQMAMGNNIGPVSTNFAVQSYDTGGYREHQEYTKVNASGRIAYELKSDSEVAFSVRRHSGHFNSPGYITEAQFNSGEDDRRKLAPTAEDDGGNRNFTSFRLDYNTMLTSNIRLLSYAYDVKQDSVRFAKFNYEAGDPNIVGGQSERIYSRDAIALGSSLNGESTIMGKPSTWVAGIEYLDETTDAARYNTVDRIRFEVAGGTGPDGETESRELVTQTTSLFSQLDIALSDKFTSTLGLRYDSFDGDALDKITDLTDIRETESAIEDYSHFSPKLGLRYEVSANWQLRASAANGYALPPGEQKYIADIQVDPVDYWQYEVGINGSPAEQWNIDLAVFSLDSSGEYQTIGDDFVNFGETNRSGLEAELRYSPASNFEILGLLGVFDSEIEKGANVGNAVTGVPEHVATLKASYTPPSSLGGTIAWRSIGEYYLTGDNSQSYEGFDVVQLTAFYNVNGEDGNLKLYLQVNNALNESYAEAVWYGDTANYAPAAERNIGVGITVKW